MQADESRVKGIVKWKKKLWCYSAFIFMLSTFIPRPPPPPHLRCHNQTIRLKWIISSLNSQNYEKHFFSFSYLTALCCPSSRSIEWFYCLHFSFTGTLEYNPPEAFTAGVTSFDPESVAIWSIGILAYRFVTGYFPFETMIRIRRENVKFPRGLSRSKSTGLFKILGPSWSITNRNKPVTDIGFYA